MLGVLLARGGEPTAPVSDRVRVIQTLRELPAVLTL
jgi:hypothetical protein